MAWALILQWDKHYTIQQSFALGMLPWILEFLSSTLHDEPKKYGFSATTNNAMLVLDILLLAGFLSESPPDHWVSTIAAKTGLFTWFINLIGFTLLPQYGERLMWGMKDRCETVDHLLYQVCGLGCAQNMVLFYLLDQNIKMDPVKALGYSFALNSVGLMLLAVFRHKRGPVQQHQMLMAVGAATLSFAMLREQQVESVVD